MIYFLQNYWRARLMDKVECVGSELRLIKSVWLDNYFVWMIFILVCFIALKVRIVPSTICCWNPLIFNNGLAKSLVVNSNHETIHKMVFHI